MRHEQQTLPIQSWKLVAAKTQVQPFYQLNCCPEVSKDHDSAEQHNRLNSVAELNSGTIASFL